MFLGQYILPLSKQRITNQLGNLHLQNELYNFSPWYKSLFPKQYQAEPLSITKKWNFSNQPIHNNWNLQVGYHKKPPLHRLLCNVSVSSQSHPKTYLNWPWLENCHYRHDIRSGVSWGQPAHLLGCYRLETAHQKSFIKTNRPMKTTLTTVNHSISLCPPPTHTKKEQPRTHQR